MRSEDPPKYSVDDIVSNIVATDKGSKGKKGIIKDKAAEPLLRDDRAVVRLILAGADAQGIKFVENDLGRLIIVRSKGSEITEGVRTLILAFLEPITKLLEDDKRLAVQAVEDLLGPTFRKND